MDGVLERGPVRRVQLALREHGFLGKVQVLVNSAKTAIEAASALEIEVGQIASSLIFRLPDGSPILIITSGGHRVDTDLVAKTLGLGHLVRADAEYVKSISGFSVGGVAPLGWEPDPSIVGVTTPLIVIDEALTKFDVIWAAGGHPHTVFPTTFLELIAATGARSLVVGP
jgi:prolyl-tRNA editing enzyme YbaK/EbsC (Cys-tRNA(Pro) deacylase)